MPVTSPGEVQDQEVVGSWFTVELKRGMTGSSEGCIYRGETLQAVDLAA